MTAQRVLITGVSGRGGRLLVPRLSRPARSLRLLDLEAPSPQIVPAGADVVIASVTDLEAMTAACSEVDAVVHLAGQADESTFDVVVDRNIRGTHTVLEAARRTGAPRVVLASSHHAAGFHVHDDHADAGLPADAVGRPDTLYGWSKVAAESLGRLYADRFGMQVIGLRLGGLRAVPESLRDLAVWLSPDDGARLVEAALTTTAPGFHLVWGISRNTRRWFTLTEGRRIGYEPRDDAEAYADALIARFGEPDFATDPALRRLGAGFCDAPLGVPMHRNRPALGRSR